MKAIATLLAGLTLVACQAVPVTPTPAPSPTAMGQETPSPTPPPRPTATPMTASPLPAPVKGGAAILGLVGQPQTLNPITENNAALREVTPLLFDTLLRVDPNTARLQSGLAQSWSYSVDGQRVTFQLPPNLKWSDGTPLTAADIAESLQATQHPALLSFSEINAPDEQTLVLTFTNIDCGAVTALAQLPIMPASQILDSLPLGSGPFIVADWPENRRTLTLAQNPNYHGVAPFLDGLTVRFIREAEVDIALSEGQFEAIGPLQAGVTNPYPDTFTNIAYPTAQVIYLAINFDPHNGSPITPQVRQSLLLALNRQVILTEALDGDGQLMAGSLLSGHWAAGNALSSPPYDPDAARSLLAEAGLTDSDGDGWLDRAGQRLELSIRLNGKNSLHQRLGWLISSYYRDLGLFARADSVPPDSVIDDLFTHDFDLAIFSWPILPDPDQRLYWHSSENTEGVGLNFVSYNNPKLDDLLENGVTVPGCRPEARAPIYTQAQDILSRERPVDFLLTPNKRLLVANRLLGLKPGPFAPFTWNVTEWHLQ